jgi:hypothetical protein
MFNRLCCLWTGSAYLTDRSLDRHDLGEGPRSIEDLCARLIHADGIVPAVGDVQIVDLIRVAAEMNGEGPVGIGFGGHIVVACRKYE